MSQALIVNPLGRGIVLKNKFGSKVLENAPAASPKSCALFLALSSMFYAPAPVELPDGGLPEVELPEGGGLSDEG
jgi:hypothetical protein